VATSKRWQVDHALIRACRSGDPKSWETLIVRYRRLIYSIPVAYRIPAAEADEIFQRVSVKLFENLGKLRKAEGLASWLAVTARRECQAYQRSSRRLSSLDENPGQDIGEDPPDVVRDLHQVECAHTLTVAMDRLGEPCRGLLSALYMEDPAPSYEEISRRLDRPIGSLGPTRARCLEKLRKLYLDMGGKGQ
jgi:RNA polymerase sigma factor (sigma-70 family)